jgi:hypothetical protein
MQNRQYISIVAGIIIAAIFIFIFETVGKLMYPSTFPIDFNSFTKEGRNTISEQMPFMSKVFALIGNAVGAFVGAAIATFVSGRKDLKPMLVVETVLFAFAILKMLVLPFPIWIWVLTPAAFFGLGYVTYRFLKKKEEELAKE